MKNQSDLICIGVCALLSIIFSVTMFFMKREPAAYPAPSAVITTTPAYPAGAVTYVNSLPGGSSNGMGGGGSFGMGAGGMAGGKSAFMGGMGGRAGAAGTGGFNKGNFKPSMAKAGG